MYCSLQFHIIIPYHQQFILSRSCIFIKFYVMQPGIDIYLYVAAVYYLTAATNNLYRTFSGRCVAQLQVYSLSNHRDSY